MKPMLVLAGGGGAPSPSPAPPAPPCQVDLAVVGANVDAGAPQSALSIILAMAALTGFLDGVGQGALYGDASLLPPEYTHVRGGLRLVIHCSLGIRVEGAGVKG